MQDYPIEIEPIQEPNNRAKKNITSIIVVLLVVILAVASALVVRYTMLSTIIVDGVSMYPTLDGGSGKTSDNDAENGETLLLYKLGTIERGDIVVFTSPASWGMYDSKGETKKLVKRVIAIGGDHIRITDNQIYLNGQLLEEDNISFCEIPDYTNPSTRGSGIDMYVPEGHIFCMGDNRNHSTDSRYFTATLGEEHGTISLDLVEGKCILIKGMDGKLRKV